MKNKILKLNCLYEKEDYIVFDSCMGSFGVDIFNYENEEEINVAVVLDKKQTEELIIFLQNQLETLK
jgi:hypothetical protein